MCPNDTPSTAGFEAWKRALSEAFIDASERRVDVYVRSTLPPLGAKSRQERVIERLDGMAERDLIDEVGLVVTGDRLCLCETCKTVTDSADVLSRVERLREWRGPSGAGATPFFERREITSSIAGENAEALVPPRVTVAITLDGAIAGVFPCQVGTETYSIDDCLDVLGEFADDEPPLVEP